MNEYRKQTKGADMKGNIIDFVYMYGIFDFHALPFGPVDALVLAQFAYLKVEGMVGSVQTDARPITLRELHNHPEKEKLFADPRWEVQNRALFEEMCSSVRYRDMQCLYHVDFVNREEEYQFAAITCILNDGSMKVVYRGTDETLVGWKEDFNMSFQYPIPGQQYGQYYLEQVVKLKRLSGGNDLLNIWQTGNSESTKCGQQQTEANERIDLIGHSKGGNLAVYAAMHVPEEIQQYIGHIYNLDGPGFRSEVYRMDYFEKIVNRVIKIIPRSSIVGMILENHGDYKVVDSTNIGFLQHDPFSWLVDRVDFVYVEQMDEGHRIMDESLNAWINSLSREEVSQVVNTLYHIVEASEATDLIGLTKNWTKSLTGMKDAYQKLDEDTKHNLHRVFISLVKASGSRFKEETGLYLQNKIDGLTQQLLGKDGF